VKLFKILQDRSKTNVFFSNCVEEEKRKNEASFFFGKKAKKNEYNSSSTIEDLPLLLRSHSAFKGQERVVLVSSCACSDPGSFQLLNSTWQALKAGQTTNQSTGIYFAQ
jgi:hypothetical protein